MTSFGILMPAIRPPKTVARGDLRSMQIRARRSRELDILRAQYMRGSLGVTLHTGDKDYEYRAYCTPESFAVALMRLTLNIDYLKFKPTTMDDYQDPQLHRCYNAIWSVVLRDLSTQAHQREYWGKFPPAKGADGVAHTYYSTLSAGYGTGSGWSGQDSMDAVLELPGSATEWPHTGAESGWRDSSADRDEYELDPALAQLGEVDEDSPTRDMSPQDLDAYLDGLYLELEQLRSQLEVGPLDHSGCGHSGSDAARARCRRRFKRERDNRQAELYKLITDAEQHIVIEPDTAHLAVQGVASSAVST